MGKYLKLLAALMLAAACGKEDPTIDPVTPPETDNEPQVVALDFQASLAEQPDGVDEIFSLETGNAIAFFCEGGSYNVSVSEAIDTVRFTQEVKAGTYYAVYPASVAKEQYGDAVMVDVPAVQNGKFEDACIWFAKTDSEEKLFELRNLCSLGSITLERDDVEKITISGNQNELISGTVYASIGQDGTINCADADSYEITLLPDEGETFVAGTYYFAVAPGSLIDGVSFTLETSGGNMLIGSAYAEAAQLERAVLMDFGTIDDISKADALRLRFIFGPEAGTKAVYDPESNWPDAAGEEALTEGVSYPYALNGVDYNFYVKDVSGSAKFAWRTNNKDGYADCIGMQTDKVYFGLPAIEGFRLTNTVVGQCRRGKGDNAETKITKVGITDRIAEGSEQKSYIAGGELQDWPGWAGSKDKKVVDHVFQLTDTKENTIYYLNSDNASIGLYFSRLVLTYQKQDCAYKGFPENWEQESGEEPADIYANADIRILFIGNSFTRDAVYHLPGMIKAAGIDKKIILTHMYYGGRTAQNYYKNWSKNRDFTCYVALPGASDWYEDKAGAASTLAEMTSRTDWDVITVQEHTGNQTSWYWTSEEKEALQGIINYIKEAKPDNTPKIHYVMSQAYQNLEKAGSNQCFTNEAEMYTVITTQARKVMGETDYDGIISTGTMLQNLRTTSLNDDLHLTRDGFHMNNGISRYGAACTMFESIITPLTGKNLDGNTYRYAAKADDDVTISVTDENAPIALEAARAAIKKPFEITNINY